MELVNTAQQLTSITNVTLACDDDKRRRSQSCYKGQGMELGNTDKQMTNITNVTLASNDNKQRRSLSCYKG